MQHEMSEWISTAEKYGAKFENVDFIYTNDTFIPYSIEKEKSFLIDIPSSLLLPRDYIVITENSQSISQDIEMVDDLKEMFNRYLNFILSDSRVSKLRDFFNPFLHLSDPLKEELKYFNLAPMFVERSVIELKKILLQTRVIHMHGQSVFMPFIDFSNHDFEKGVEFQLEDGSAIIQGLCSDSGEIFTVYNRLLDTFSYLRIYQFVPNTINAMSMQFTLKVGEEKKFSVGRVLKNFTHQDIGLLSPKADTLDDETILLSAVWIGSKRQPLKPYQSFKFFWEEKLKRADTQRIYSRIKGANIKRLTKIIRLCDQSEKSHATQLLKECALQQLMIIGGSFE